MVHIKVCHNICSKYRTLILNLRISYGTLQMKEKIVVQIINNNCAISLFHEEFYCEQHTKNLKC